MIRIAGWLIIGAMTASVTIALLGRAIDQQVQMQDRVIFTKQGVTLDCVRRFGGHGSVSYNDCHQVP